MLITQVVNFVRATARILREVRPPKTYISLEINAMQKENISINVVLPGIVHTSIIPPEMVAAVSEEW
jgi:hypothetical protein